MEASAIEYRGGRGALDFQHSPLGGSVADCGPSGPHQTEFKQEYGHHNGHPQAAMEHEDIKSCYSSTPSTPPTPMGEEPVPTKVKTCHCVLGLGRSVPTDVPACQSSAI